MIKGNAFDQVCQVLRLAAQTIGYLYERVNENIFHMEVHIEARNYQGIFQLPPVNTDYFVEETGEEDCMAGLIDKLRREVDTHLLVGHCYDVGSQSISNAYLTLKEASEAIEVVLLLFLQQLFPLDAVGNKVDIVSAPLLMFPTIIEFPIGR